MYTINRIAEIHRKIKHFRMIRDLTFGIMVYNIYTMSFIRKIKRGKVITQ